MRKLPPVITRRLHSCIAVSATARLDSTALRGIGKSEDDQTSPTCDPL